MDVADFEPNFALFCVESTADRISSTEAERLAMLNAMKSFRPPEVRGVVLQRLFLNHDHNT